MQSSSEHSRVLESATPPQQALSRAVVRAAIILATSLMSIGAAAEAEIRQDDLDSSLVDAARQGDLPSFNLALRLGANISARDRHGNNAVLAATEGGQSRLLHQLLDKGVDANTLGASGFTPLTYAAMTGAADDAARLLRADANPNQHNVLGNAPLHLASQFGRKRIVDLLIAAGARIDDVNGAGDTPLLSALHAGQRQAFADLLAAGANPNVRDRTGQSALTIAILEERPELALVLLDRGAEFHTRNGSYTPLRLAKFLGLASVIDELSRRGAPE